MDVMYMDCSDKTIGVIGIRLIPSYLLITPISYKFTKRFSERGCLCKQLLVVFFFNSFIILTVNT